MANRAPPQPHRDKEWEIPSGRAPARRDRPASFKAAFARALKGASRASAAGGSGARARIDTPLPGANSRRVVVKVRIAQVGSAFGKRAAALHLAYIEREGVERDGGSGQLYGRDGPVARAEFEQELAGEKHQFRLVVSPEDAHELDLRAYVRSYVEQLERDLGRRLRWAAVNHHDTDNPHAHIVIRGLDENGAEVRMDRQYVSHGLRHRAQELATRELGPRPERSRLEQLGREAQAERYTALDHGLERRAVDGVVTMAKTTAADRRRDPHYEGALRQRLEKLEHLGLAQRVARGRWKLGERLREGLELFERRADGLKAIGKVLAVSPHQCRVIDRHESRDAEREELERGVHGILRWKGLDPHGRFCVVAEMTNGNVYHLPVSDRIASEAKVGQVVQLKKAVDKDQRLADIISKNGGVCDLGAVGEHWKETLQRRLEQLERMRLATRRTDERWEVRGDFRVRLAKGKAQPYWQMLSLRPEAQDLSRQARYLGPVWLDRVPEAGLGSTGFGREVRNALRVRAEYLRGLGLDPESKTVRWKLKDLQQLRLEQQLEAGGSGRAIRARDGLEGTLRVHREENGEIFAEIRAHGGFALVSVSSREGEALEGQTVRIDKTEPGRVRLGAVDDRERRK